MLDTMLIAPLTPFSSLAKRRPGFASLLAAAFASPGRWMEARRIRAELAGLSEREWSDIGFARAKDEAMATSWNDEDPAERAARARAIRAWYGHDQKAA